MADEILSGVLIPITSDWSDLDKSMDAALSDATQKSQAIASAITSALGDIKPPDVSAITGSLEQVGAAATTSTGQIQQMAPALDGAGQSAGGAVSNFEALASAMAALASALAITEGLRELGMAALEAADHVDDATQAMAKLGGGAEAAQATVAQLRGIASDEALSFPGLLLASQRMTAFLGDATKVPEVMQAAGNAAAIMGTSIETASKSIERFAAGGDLSAKALKNLGLTMGDMAAALGTTEENAKAAFAALDQSGKIDAVVAALGKFNGAAKEMNDDALGAFVRLGQQWNQVLEEIGKALDPVIKELVDFASANIVQPIKSLVEAFNQLPAPVKDFAVAIGIAAAAIVPIAAGIAGVLAVIGPLEAALAGVGTAVAGVAEVIGGALAISLSEVLIPIAAVGAAVAVLHFTGLGDDIMEFLQGPLAALKEAFSVAAEVITKELSDIGTSVRDTMQDVGGLLRDLGGLVEDVVGTAFKPLVDALKDVADQLGVTTPKIDSFRDAVKIGLDLTTPVEALKGLDTVLHGIKDSIDLVRPAIQLLSNDMGLAKQATKDFSSAIQYQQDLANQNARLLADQAMGLNQVATASNAYAAGLKTIQEQQEKLNAAVTQAKGVLDAANAAYDGTSKSIDVINRAQADYEKAVKAATSATDAHKKSIDQVSASFITYDSALRDFHDISSSITSDTQHQSDMMEALGIRAGDAAKSLENAKQNLGYWVDELNQATPGTNEYNTALQNVSKWAQQVEKDQKAANTALDDFNKKGAELGSAAWISQIKTAGDNFKAIGDNLKNLGIDLDTTVPKISPLNQALIDAGANATKAKNAFVDLHTPVETIVTDIGNLVKIGQSTGDWTPLLTGLDNIDKRVNELAKTDLPEAVRQLQAYITALQNSGAPIEVVQGQLDKLGSLIDKMAKEGYPGAKAALDAYLDSLKKVPSAIDDIQAKEEAQLSKDQAILASMQARGDAYGYILQQQAKVLQEEIAYDERTGQDASKAIYNLKAIGLQQEILKDQTHGLADTYVAMFDDINKGFDQMAQAMADAIVNGKNLGDALVGVFKKIATSILDDLIKGALKPLEDELKKAESDLLGMLGGSGGGGASEGGGALGGGALPTTGHPGDYGGEFGTQPANADGSSTNGGSSGGVGGGGTASTVGAIGAVAGAIAGAIGDVFLKAISEKLFNIQTSLLAIQNDTANRRKDAWDQFGQEYLRLGEVMNRLDRIIDILGKTSLSGGGFPDQALTDLNDIALAARQQYQLLPTIQGALQTIATDIVSGIQDIEGNYLSVIVQKLGEILTNGLTASSDLSAMSSLPADIASAASDISGAVADTGGDIAAVGDAVASASDDAGQYADDISGTITAASSDLAAHVDTSSTDIVSAVSDVTEATTMSSDAVVKAYTDNANAIVKPIVDSIDRSGQETTDALLKQLAADQKIADQGGSTVQQIISLQNELKDYQGLIDQAIKDGNTKLAATYQQAANSVASQIDNLTKSGQIVADRINALKDELKIDTQLMNDAIAKGDLDLAAKYQQAAANVQSELLPLLSDTAVYTRDAADTLGRMSSTLDKDITGVGMAATSAGTLVAAHVDAAATSIGTAVAQAVSAVGFASKGNQSTGGGTTTSADYSAGQKNTGQGTAPATAGTGVPTGTQPGFSPTTLPSANGIPTPTGNGNPSLGGNPSSPTQIQPSSGTTVGSSPSPPPEANAGAVNPGTLPLPVDVNATNPYGTGSSSSAEQLISIKSQMEQLQKQIDADMKAGNADKAQAEEAQYLALQTEAQLLEKIIAVQLQLKDSQASGNTQLSQILQDQLTTMQQQLAVAEAAVNGSETSGGLKSGLGSHPGLVGQPIQVSVTADNNFGSISSIKNAPYPTQTTASSDNSLTQQALQVQMDTVKAELEKAQAALLAAQQQANAPGQFGNPGIIKQEEMLNQQIQLLTQQMATLQKAYADAGGVTADNNFGSIGSIKNAPYPTSTSTVSASGYSSPPAQPDPQTLGFYAGALAELEDIRNTIHSERDLISSMRDSWVTIAKGMLVIMGSDGASQGHAMPKFEGGGDVPRTMIAQVEQGEHIIPSDISGMLRQMVRTPNYAQMTTPSYSDSKQVPKSVNITMPVTVNNARDGRQLAIDLTRHIKHMTSDGGAYSD